MQNVEGDNVIKKQTNRRVISSFFFNFKKRQFYLPIMLLSIVLENSVSEHKRGKYLSYWLCDDTENTYTFQ